MTDIYIPTKKIPIALDATMLTNIMKCGRLTQFKHEMHLQPLAGKSNSIEIGAIIHKFLEVYYRNQSRGISRSQAFGFGISAAELYIQGCPDCTKFEPIPEKCSDPTAPFGVHHYAEDNRNICLLCNGSNKPKCGHQIDEYPGLTNTPDQSTGYIIGWKFALQTCDEYHSFYSSDYWVTVDTEVVKSKVLYEDDEIRLLFKSKLDWIVDTNNGINPCDHKTMKQNRDTLSINNQFMGQCLQLGVRNIFINKIGLQKTLKPEEKFKRVNISYSADRLIEWQSFVLPYWAKQLITMSQSNIFPPNFNSCESKFGKCEFYDVCEADRDMREETIKMNFYRGNEWNPVNTED